MTRAAPPGGPPRSPANRSLQRGVSLLRAFGPGAETLGNGELAERTGLSKATVSRLAQTLVGSGMLDVDPVSRAYRLAPAVLGLAHAMRSTSTLLRVAAPRMHRLAQARRINVGLAAPDGEEMVYLETVRYNRRPSLRTVVSGQRVPMELTSLGRAYLAVAPDSRRRALLASLRRRRSSAAWLVLARAIDEAIEHVRRHGWCAASWQPEVVAVAAPLAIDATHVVVFNVSVSSAAPARQVADELAPSLRALVADVRMALGVSDAFSAARAPRDSPRPTHRPRRTR